MTNLSDLFPAGAGKQVSFVATGTLASGATVALKSDGTVEAVAETTISPSMPLGTESNVTSQTAQYNNLHADPHNSNRWMQIWMDDAGTKYVRVRVIVRSGTTLTMGSISTVETTNGQDRYCNFAWDNTTSGKFLVVYRNSQEYLQAKVGTISDAAGNSISYGSVVTFSTSPTTGAYPSTMGLECLGTTGNYFLQFINSSNNYPYGRIISVSGTVPSAAGSNTVLVSSAMSDGITKCVVNPSDSSKVASVYGSGSNVYVYNISITGTTITPGTPVSAASGVDAGVDILGVDATRYVFAYRNSSNKQPYGGIATFSGGSWSIGTEVSLSSSEIETFGPSLSNAVNPVMNLQGSVNTFVIAYRDWTNTYLHGVIGTISGTSITVNTPAALTSQATRQYNKMVALQSDSNGTFLAAYGLTGSSLNTFIRLGQSGGTSNNSADFIGITDAAISSAASGNVTIKGGIAVNGLSSLTPGSDYYAQADGTISTVSTGSAVKIGRAMSATSINLEYQS